MTNTKLVRVNVPKLNMIRSHIESFNPCLKGLIGDTACLTIAMDMAVGKDIELEIKKNKVIIKNE
jgi:hypothetical protein